MKVDHAVTQAVVTAELESAARLARLHEWELEFDREALTLIATQCSRVDGERYRYLFTLTDYRALPPIIDAVHIDTDEINAPSCFPANSLGYFHNQNLICAPWSRRAYKSMNGPHGDWDMARWATAQPNRSSLGDMLGLLQQLIDDRGTYNGRKQKR